MSSVLSRNLNVYWLAFTGLAVWFLFVHSPPVLIERKVLERPLFVFHLLGATLVYLACIHNTLWTPGTILFRRNVKTIHKWVGLVGLVAGLCGFVGGLVMNIVYWDEIDTGFAVGITIGGVLQVLSERDGFNAIQKYLALKEELVKNGDSMAADKKQTLLEERDAAVQSHISEMIGLFTMACSIPAGMRLAGIVGVPSPWGNAVVVVACNVLRNMYTKKMIPAKKKTKAA